MTERIRGISRQDDENLYQPQIHSRRIRELYGLGEATGLPMTVLIDFAIAEYVERITEHSQEGDINRDSRSPTSN